MQMLQAKACFNEDDRMLLARLYRRTIEDG